MDDHEVNVNEMGPVSEKIINNSSSFDEDIRESCPSWKTIAGKSVHGICTRKQLRKRFPVLTWLPSYSLGYLVEDIVAGLSVGLTVIPQGIAYAVVANLEPQYGLYSAFMGCFIYCIFGTCKDLTIGPTAIMSLMVQVHVADLGPDFAILAAFLAGIITLLLGLLNLGFLVNFISMPVTAGFTSAAAITIASGQMKSLLGIHGKSNEFLESWINVFKRIEEVRLWDSLLGVSSIVVLLLLMNLKMIKGFNRCSCFGKYVVLSRNAIVVVSGTLLAYLLSEAGYSDVFLLTGNVTAGLPSVQVPPFSTSVEDRMYNFSDMIYELGTSVIALPLIGILESIAIAKAFSKGKSVDATQEMIALGLCNIAGSFVSSMPVTGSFTRSAVNNSSGVRTTFGGIITGIVVLLALGLLTNTFYYIPKAVLAGVIITAMFFMIDFKVAKEIWRTKRIDIVPMIVTFITCLFLGLEYGMVIGIVVNVCLVLYEMSRPKITFKKLKVDSRCLLIVQPDQSLVYSSAEYFEHQVVRMASKEDVSIIVVDGSHITSVDTTTAQILMRLTRDLALQNHIVIYWKWNRSARCTLLRMDVEYFRNIVTKEENLDIVLKEVNMANLLSVNSDIE